MSKLSVKTRNTFSVGGMRFLGRWIAANLYRLAVKLSLGYPSSTAFFKRYSLETVLVRPQPAAVVLILRVCSNSKIVAAIVERIPAFNVVGLPFIATLQAENFTVHVDGVSSSPWSGGVPSGVKTSRAIIPIGVPLPLIKPIVISGINDGELSLSKFDSTVRCSRASLLFTQVHVGASPKAFAARP